MSSSIWSLAAGKKSFRRPKVRQEPSGANPTLITTHAKLNTYHATLFANFLTKLRATPDGDGSLLDHSLILYGSGMSESEASAVWLASHRLRDSPWK